MKHLKVTVEDLQAIEHGQQALGQEPGKGEFMFTIGLGTEDRNEAIRRAELVINFIHSGLAITGSALDKLPRKQ